MDKGPEWYRLDIWIMMTTSIAFFAMTTALSTRHWTLKTVQLLIASLIVCILLFPLAVLVWIGSFLVDTIHGSS